MPPVTVGAYVAVSFLPYLLAGLSDKLSLGPDDQWVLWALLSLVLLYKLVRGSRVAWTILLVLDVLALVLGVFSAPAPIQLETGALLGIIALAVLLLLAPPTRRFVH